VVANKTAKIFDIAFGFFKRETKRKCTFSASQTWDFYQNFKKNEGPFAHMVVQVGSSEDFGVTLLYGSRIIKYACKGQQAHPAAEKASICGRF
jgi:hypothetical protein